MVRPLFKTRLAEAKARTKSLLGTWPMAKAVAYVADDAMWGLSQRLGRIQSESGSTHRALAVEESVGYVEEVFNDYRTYGALDGLGGTAAEVGPGDNAGVALLLQAAGCETVELIDRFRSRRSLDQQRRIYQELAVRNGIHQPGKPGSWDDERLPGIIWKVGSSAEAYFARRALERQPGYRLIVSRATLEHLYDPLGALRSMAACLQPGGRMVHKIDFRDHGMFTPAHPELTFLRFSAPLYRRMTRRSGRPNRVLLHRYQQLAAELGRSGDLEVTILATSLVGEGQIVPHVPLADLPAQARQRAVAQVEAERHRFAKEFANVPPEELAVTGIFWVGVRPLTDEASALVRKEETSVTGASASSAPLSEPFQRLIDPRIVDRSATRGQHSEWLVCGRFSPVGTRHFTGGGVGRASSWATVAHARAASRGRSLP